jgi:hypothetical protein
MPIRLAASNGDGRFQRHVLLINEQGNEWSAYVPRMSLGTLPLLNLPVALWPGKSWPYGGKLQRISVVRALLLPGSTMESPNTISAGGRVCWCWFAVDDAAVVVEESPEQSRRMSTAAVAIMRRRGRDAVRLLAMSVLDLCLLSDACRSSCCRRCEYNSREIEVGGTF